MTVTNQADLERYAGAAGRHVIRVQGRITISPLGHEVRVANDKTIVGVGSTGEIRAGEYLDVGGGVDEERWLTSSQAASGSRGRAT